MMRGKRIFEKNKDSSSKGVYEKLDSRLRGKEKKLRILLRVLYERDSVGSVICGMEMRGRVNDGSINCGSVTFGNDKRARARPIDATSSRVCLPIVLAMSKSFTEFFRTFLRTVLCMASAPIAVPSAINPIARGLRASSGRRGASADAVGKSSFMIISRDTCGA